MYDYFTAKVFVVSVSTEYKSCSSEDLTLNEALGIVNSYITEGFSIDDIMVTLTHPIYVDQERKLTLKAVGSLFEVKPSFVGNRFAGYYIDFYIK